MNASSPTPCPKFSVFFESTFLETAAASLAAETVQNYHALVKQFADFCGSDVPLDVISRETLHRFRDWLSAKGLSRQKCTKLNGMMLVILHAWRPHWPLEQIGEVQGTLSWHLEAVVLKTTGANLSEETIRKYRRVVVQFAQFCGSDLQLADVTEQLLKSFQDSLVASGISLRTAGEVISILTKILRCWRPEWPIEPVKEDATGKKPSVKRKGRGLTLQNYFETVYLAVKLKERKPSYRQKFCNTMTRFISFTRRDVAIADVSPELFARYKDWFLETRRGAAATVYGDVVRLRMIAVAAGRADLRVSRMRQEAAVRMVKGKDTDIDTFYSEVYLKHRNVGAAYDQQIRLTLRNLRRFFAKRKRGANRTVLLSELPNVINDWLLQMEQSLSPGTVKRRRAAIISVWKLAAEMQFCDPPLTHLIRSVRVERPTPDAFTMEEMKNLIDACKMFDDRFYPNGLKRSSWWEAFIRVCYDTALRRGDMMAIKWSDVEQIDGRAIVRSVQRKTGDGIIHALSPPSVRALDALLIPQRELVFDYPYNMDTFHDHWKDVLAHAGLDPLDRRNGVQKLRRTSASHLERLHSGVATAHLGHRSPDMAMKHYLDPKISRGALPLPPVLEF